MGLGWGAVSSSPFSSRTPSGAEPCRQALWMLLQSCELMYSFRGPSFLGVLHSPLAVSLSVSSSEGSLIPKRGSDGDILFRAECSKVSVLTMSVCGSLVWFLFLFSLFSAGENFSDDGYVGHRSISIPVYHHESFYCCIFFYSNSS